MIVEPESQAVHKAVIVLKTYPAVQVKWTVGLVHVAALKVAPELHVVQILVDATK